VLACEAREAIVATLRDLTSSGLVIGTAGNVSIRADDGLVAVSPSGMSYAAMSAEDVCVVDLNGVLVEGRADPSSEMQLHLSIYSARAVGAIVHTHSRAAVAVSTLVDELPRHHYYIAQLGGRVAVAPYFTYGTRELADAVTHALDGSDAALMSNHGAVAVGATIAEARYRATILEWLCDTWLLARASGNPRLLTPDQLNDVRDRVTRNIYEEIATNVVDD
jgi:L-fuculose-phosphate aldolase